MDQRAAPMHFLDVGERQAPDHPPEDQHLERRGGDPVGDRPHGRQERQDHGGDQHRLHDQQAGHAKVAAVQDTSRYNVSL